MKNRQAGTSVFIVLIIGTALSFAAYSALEYVMGEMKRNRKAYVYHEARQASEALIQSGFADLHTRFSTRSAFPVNSLSPTQNPLSVPSEFVTLHAAADSNIVVPTSGNLAYSSIESIGSEETELIGGQIPPGEWRYINPDSPGNEFDEMKGTRVFVRGIELLSKATARHPVWGESTAFSRQILEVRDAPLFAYAIFYNVPMEIAPGPTMNVYGPVHSNLDMWVQSGSGLYFHDKMTLAGDLYHGRHPDSGKSSSSGAVQVVSGTGDMVSLKEDSTWDDTSRSLFGGGWLESDDGNFIDLVANLWGGNLLTGDHGIRTQNPVGVADYVEDTDDSTNAKESLNSAYNMIQPVLNENTITAVTDQVERSSLQSIESQKYSYKAGLTISVDNSGNVSYHTYERDAGGKLVYDDAGNPEKVELVPNTAIARSESFNSYINNDGDEVITAGMHDKRMGQDLNMVEVDMAELTAVIHNDDANDWSEGEAPSNWWNGIVYVEFPQKNSSSSREDYVNPAIGGWGVKLVDGDTIPNPSFAQSDDIYGTSIATNQMLYIEGNYNSDGDSDTGSPTTADSNADFADEGSEAPAALIADSITFLSENWDDSRSSQSKSDRNASDTEVSAAIMTGMVPSGETGSASYSGGVENFPRFLETWSGDTLTYRGSMVALFESEVATERWGKSDVYSPPKRNWGFHEKFAEGFLPPGTPTSRGFRGRDFTDLNATEYAGHINRIKTNFGE